jgi:hypothetical protein
MGLPLPEEPKGIKELIKAVRARLGDRGSVDYDSLSVWAFNRLPKYLWGHWGDELKRRGITWQKFLKIMKLHTLDVVAWALHDELEWAELAKRIEHTIETYSESTK